MVTKKELVELFHISLRTVDYRLNELEEYIPSRYGRHSLIRDVGYVLVNPYVFADFLVYRKRLKAGFNVEEFNLLRVKEEMGYAYDKKNGK